MNRIVDERTHDKDERFVRLQLRQWMHFGVSVVVVTGLRAHERVCLDDDELLSKLRNRDFVAQ